MNNNLRWSYEKPGEAGLYFVCRGDVEVLENMELCLIGGDDTFAEGVNDSRQRIHAGKIVRNIMLGQTEIYSYGLDFVKHWSDSFKFARICFGSEVKDVT